MLLAVMLAWKARVDMYVHSLKIRLSGNIGCEAILVTSMSKLFCLLFSAIVIGCSTQPSMADSFVPQKAWQHQRLLIRVSLAELGTDRYVASLAAQTYQESNWRNDLKSRVGAIGPSQFMPSTAKWFIKDMARGLPCRSVGDFLDYGCAIPAQVRYMAMLRRGVKDTANECERWAMATAKYNGGGIKADRRLAQATGKDYGRWFNHTELFNGRKRASYNFKENRHYPRVILFKHQPKFLSAGYRGSFICSEIN